MPTIIIFQSAAGFEQYVWPAVFTFLGSLAAALIGFILYRRKYRSDVQYTDSETRKTEMETALSILDRLPDFLKRLEDAHKKTLADETTIEKLRYELEKCVGGQTDCKELKDTLIVFLRNAEVVIQKIEEATELLSELRRLKLQLEG